MHVSSTSLTAARRKRAAWFLLSVSTVFITYIAPHLNAAEVTVTSPNSIGEMPLGIAPNLVPALIPAIAPPAPVSAVAPPLSAPNTPLSKSATLPSLSNPRAESVTLAKAAAKGSSSDPAWKDLPAAQQQALAPLQPEWDKLDNRHKTKWIEIGKKFAAMKPDERVRIQGRMRAWVALTPDQRRVARESYVRTKKLNNDQKSAQWERYKSLPEEQKKKLAAEAAKNKVASPPSGTSKTRIVLPIKSTSAPILRRSVTPAARGSVILSAPLTSAASPTSAATATAVHVAPPSTLQPASVSPASPVQVK